MLIQRTDKCHLVFFIFILHGIGTLIPWNVFINARDYFINFKLNTTTSYDKDYRINFMGYVGFSAQLPNLIMCGLNTFYQGSGTLSEKCRFSTLMTIQLFVMCTTVFFAIIDTTAFPSIFFAITMISIILINASTGVYQTLIYGAASVLPIKYTNAVVMGSNFSGTLISIFNLITKGIANGRTQLASILYFTFAMLILLVCCISYTILPRLSFYRFYKEGAQATASQDIRYLKFYKTAFKKSWIHCLSVFSVFLCTLTIFPTIQSSITATNPYFYISKDWFTDITCFLFFNLFALFGNLVSYWIQFPKSRYLWLFVWMRTLIFIPFFLFCNFANDRRVIPVFITNDHVYIIGVVIFAFTSGYFSSLCMMYVSQEAGSLASMIATFSLVCGVTAGANISLALIKAVCNEK